MARNPESFDEVAELYDRARPPYPQAVIDDLLAGSGIRPGERVLEIGCGTGQITVPLAERDLHITALEPGANLAAIARDKLASYPEVAVVERRFEDYELPPEQFDLVVSSMAFHWVDPQIRVLKSTAALRPGGLLAVIQTHYGCAARRDEFALRSQSCYLRWEPDADPRWVPPTIADLPATPLDLAESDAFTVVLHRFYEQFNRYTTASYLDLMRTTSLVLGMEPAAREGLLGCIGQLIDDGFGGEFTRSDTRELWLASLTGADC